MKGEIPYTLREAALRQCGVVSRQQAIRAGLTADAIKFRVRSGRWRQLHSGVYALFTGPPDRGAQLWAAVLWAGSGAVLSYETAAELNRLIDKPTDRIHVTVPSVRRVVAVSSIAIHRSARVNEARHPSREPPQTRVEETVLDLTQVASSFDDVCGWVTRAFGRRLTNEERVRTAMGLRAKMRWRSELDELVGAAVGGTHSVLEFRYDRDVERAHGLPESTHQLRFQGSGGGRRGYRDRYYEEYGVVVELDGQVAHPAETRWRDIGRDNAAMADGKLTLRYGWRDVTQACSAAAQLAQVLQTRGWNDWPRPCSPSCPVSQPGRVAS
jgi:hypothetical protein